MSSRGDEGFRDCFVARGRCGEDELCEVDETTLFDLASLTKPLVTLPAVLLLLDEGKISWDEPLHSLLETPLPRCFDEVDLHSLLCHSGGFSAHRDLWRRLVSIDPDRQKEWLLKALLDGYPAYERGTTHRYSDLGYILLGLAVEKKTGQTLDRYWKSRVCEPSGLEDSLLFGPWMDPGRKKRCVPTGFCRWSGELLAGTVHDDNCRALGGVAGHAGLFGSSRGVLALCRDYVNIYHGRPGRLAISAPTFRRACLPVGDEQVSEWSCGFNRPSVTGSSSGRYFSRKSIGHLGFTGVSFWIDLDRQIIVTLLTNRVVKGDDPAGIRKLRPELHDAVMRCLL